MEAHFKAGELGVCKENGVERDLSGPLAVSFRWRGAVDLASCGDVAVTRGHHFKLHNHESEPAMSFR